MKTEQRQRLLRILHKRCKGRCTNCNVEVGLAFELIKKGWEILEREAVLMSPKGELIFLATIEHLTPRSKNGSNNLSNLTLFCAYCNRKTSHFGRPLKEKEIKFEEIMSESAV